MDYDKQKQIDRACAAQDPSLLPETTDMSKLEAARQRVEAQKSEYKVPAQSMHW